MPVTVAETATFAATIDTPQDGDAAQASSPGSPAGNATIEEVVQNLANRTKWLRARGLRRADSNNELSALTDAPEAIEWIASAGLATTTLVKLDTGADWRDRIVEAEHWDFTAASGTRPGQATDYDFRTGVVGASVTSVGYTGVGAYSNITTGAAVANGAPPIAGAGAFRSYRHELTASLFLYADPTTGALYLYNNSGATVWLRIRVWASGDTGKR